jgi:hypothetical protein
MLHQSLRKLASVAPNNAFGHILQIADLERQLGLPMSRPTFNGVRAKARIEALQAQLAAKSAPQVQAAPAAPSVPAPAPTPTAPAPVREITGLARAAASFKADATAHAAKPAPVATAAPVASELMSTAKLVALCEHVFGKTPQNRGGCLHTLRLSGVTVPGVEPDPHRIEVTGFNRMFRDSFQAKADSYLANNPK